MTKRNEATIQDACRLKINTTGGTLWRNNSGACTDATGRIIRYGLGNDSQRINAVMKSSDLIGIQPVRIQPHHVGQTFGLFVAVECKPEGWKLRDSDKRAQAQLNFINRVNILGGAGMFCTNEQDLLAVLGTY